ncbi:MAG: beta-ketoacyl-ACP synthase 3 [Actinomycetota bacterium]|nr:beta-ketoacyl-ACP synthase 3 [Actinomycetota bacterium]
MSEIAPTAERAAAGSPSAGGPAETQGDARARVGGTTIPGREARARLGGAAILSVATELPPGRLTNADLASRLGISEEWILSRTGIKERGQVRPEERLSDYAARVGARALELAGVQAQEIDLVLVATMSQDELTPNTAPLVAHALGTNAGGIDIGAACTGFISGLALGAALIESDRAAKVLLVGADFITRITDYEDKRTAALFADAAGAVVLGAAGAGAGAIGPVVLGSDGSHAATLNATHAERKIRMDGPAVFRHAIDRMGEVTLKAIDKAGLSLDDIDLFVYHQANARITRGLGERLQLPPERVVDCIESLGNASAATVPVALAAAQRDGRLRAGARVLLSAFGAGFTWGGAVIEWGAVPSA